ncbi:hypothetical protein EK21DRAFT_114619 [Setomelanomma holmii]|uniref:GPI ethanolamine phosphate transferase 2 n=1 Tax=Setomelanomma holmii TaxID=210430 RepID=A0A9P4H3T3_9PLEO|nr:hypothetical protein EK21DRAFT_114619 [Setomelanomma holmii]
MVRYRHHLYLAAANLLVPAGVVLFIIGFFRSRPPVSHPTAFDAGSQTLNRPASAPFDKVIFMMVDALRSDFVYTEGTGFEYTQSLIRSGAAIPFTARAASPTLTLSRVKALTQGTSQSFLDIWLNVFESESARSLAGADTWLYRLKSERSLDKKMVFYGADLWLDVYSDIFDRFEGTDAWYLPEFTTVDSNVTRHLPHELDNDDWKALILHYLGLDNIAHQGGPSGAHMLPKQAQMDDVVKLVYAALESKAHLSNTLFVLLGDHGMTDQGNHGGASPGEIAAAMVFMSPKLRSISSGMRSPVPPTKDFEYYSVINQVDFVPTLAGLMGFTTPARSLGIFAPDVLDLFDKPEDGLRVLSNNAQQLKMLLEFKYDLTHVSTTSCTEQCGECADDLGRVLCCLEKFETTMQSQDALDPKAIEELKQITRTFCDYAQRLLNMPPNNPSHVHLAASIAALSISMLLLLRVYSWSGAPYDRAVWAFVLTLTLHAPTMFMNELVVNEYHYWYCASLSWLAYLGYKRMNAGEHWLKAITYPVGLQFISQSLNEATNPQFSVVNRVHDLFSGHQVLFWIPGLLIYVSALTSVTIYLGMGSVASMLASTALCIVGILSRLSSSLRLSPTSFDFTPLWFKELISSVNRNESLHIFWAGLGTCFVAVVVQSKMSGRVSRKATVIGIVELANLYLRSLARPEHLVLFPIFDLQLQWLSSSKVGLNPSDVAMTSLLLGQSAFFASGHSNSFASFDLTNGFNGIETSRAVAVAIQALLSNYFGPVWWSLSSLRLLLAWSESRNVLSDSLSETFLTVSDAVKAGSAASDSKADNCNGHANGVVKEILDDKAHGSHLVKSHTNKLYSVLNGVDTNIKVDGNIRISQGDNKASAQQSKNRLQVNASTTQVYHARNGFTEHLIFQTFYTASTSLAVVLACIWKRNDPSIWTVLTPKCLNIILWAVFQQLMVNSMLCTATWLFVVM